MKVTIRCANAGDIDTLVSLLQELFSIESDFACDPDKQRRGLELLLAGGQDCCIYVADYQGTAVGMCTLQRLVSTAEGGYVGLVEDLIIARSFRGRGIGRQLLSWIEIRAKTQGLTRLQLLADRTNQPALSFYRKEGWVTTDLVGLRKLMPIRN